MLGTATNLWMVFVSRMIVGIVKQTMTVARACCAEACSPEDRPTAFNNIMTVTALAFVGGLYFFHPLWCSFASGPAVSSYLMAYGTLLPTLISCSVYLVDLLLVYFFMPDEDRQGTSPLPPFSF